MSIRVAVPVLLSCFAFSASMFAQEVERVGPDFDALIGRLKYRLADSGALEIWPDPSRGDDTDPNYARFFETLYGRGPSTFDIVAALGCLGANDIASSADASRILRHLDRDDDVALFDAIRSPASSPRSRSLRALAIRCAQDRGLKPAIGLLRELAGSEGLGVIEERACREAIAVLRGEPLPASPLVLLEPIEALLRSPPLNPGVVAVVDHWRLPSSRQLVAGLVKASIQQIQEVIRVAGGSVSLSQWAGATLLSERVGVAGYELARRFGNHRIDRTVWVAGRLARDAEFWLVVDGVFDSSSLCDGLTAAFGVTWKGIEGRFEGTLDGGISVTVGTRRIELRRAGEGSSKAAAESITSLLAGLRGDDAPIRLRATEGWSCDAVLGGVDASSLRAVSVTIPRDVGAAARVTVECSDEVGSEALSETAIESRLEFRAWSDAYESDVDLDRLIRDLAAIPIRARGKLVEARLRIDSRHLRGLALAIARSANR